MTARRVAAAVVTTVPFLAAGGAQAATTSPYAPYLVQRGDIPGISPYTTAVVPLTGPALRQVVGEATARWARSHGFAGGAFDAPQFNEPGVSRPYSGQVEATVAAFNGARGATGAAARLLAFNRAVSEARHRAPLRVPQVPSARLVVEYGRDTGGTVTHPAAAVVVWTEGSCMLSVSIGGDTSRARESYTRYTERALHRIERRTHGRCSLRDLRFGGGLLAPTAPAGARADV